MSRILLLILFSTLAGSAFAAQRSLAQAEQDIDLVVGAEVTDFNETTPTPGFCHVYKKKNETGGYRFGIEFYGQASNRLYSLQTYSWEPRLSSRNPGVFAYEGRTLRSGDHVVREDRTDDFTTEMEFTEDGAAPTGGGQHEYTMKFKSGEVQKRRVICHTPLMS